MEKKQHNNWYILFVRGGHEKQVINSIHGSLRNHQLEEQVAEIKILEAPNKAGKIKNLLSSYLFVNCLMSRKLLTAFYSTPGVISFLNHDKSDPSRDPVGLSTLEANNLLSIARRKNSAPGRRDRDDNIQKQFSPRGFPSKPAFTTGDLILIKEGFFKGHRGLVTKTDPKKETVTINIDFFGRLTPVSVKFMESEKV